MDRKTLLTTLLIGGGTDAGTAIAQLQHAVSVLDETKADKTGTVALANNLTPYSADSGATQSVPFNNQGTGCGNGESIVDTGSYAQVKKKLGNTVTVNMPIKLRTASQYGLSASMGADGVITISGVSSTVYSPLWENFTPIVGHYYLLGSSIVANPNNISFSFGFLNCSPNKLGNVGTYAVKQIATSANSSVGIADFALGTDFTGVKIRLFVVDLSLWFGSTSNIPAHLLSHPEDFGRYYSGSLATNPGQLVDADGSVLTSLGRNQWNEDWYALSGNQIGSNSFSECIPGATYFVYCGTYTTSPYFVNILFFDKDKTAIGGNNWKANQTVIAPINARYFKIQTNWQSYVYGATYLNDITVSLYYSGESGYDQYYPYSVLAQIDTGSEVLRSAGAVADEKTPDGTITRRVGVVDLGTLTWEKQGSQFRCSLPSIKLVPNYTVANLACAKYTAVTTTVITSSSPDKVIAARDASVGGLRVYDTAYSSGDAAAFKTAMSGVMVYYELATPTTEQGTPFSGASADNFAIDDFGSMYWTQTNGVPQGVEIFYPYDYKAAIDTLLNMVSGDVEELVTETELGAVADRIPEAPAEDGTYTLKATVADGVKTYAWVVDA